MRVRIEYTTDVSDDYRRAINHHYGRPGLASRAEVKRWLVAHGSAQDDDLMYDLDNAEEENDGQDEG